MNGTARKLVPIAAVVMLAGACSTSSASDKDDGADKMTETEQKSEASEGEPTLDAVDDTNAEEVVKANIDEAQQEEAAPAESVKMAAGAPTIEGPLTIEAFRDQLGERGTDLRYCYTQLLETNPDAGGDIVVNMTVTAEGAVESAVIESEEIDDEVFDECVTAAFTKSEFGQNSGASAVVVPLDFYVD